MSKIEFLTDWIDHYNNGGELEQSRDTYNWYDLLQEPSINDGWHYRPKVTHNNLGEAQANDPIIPDDDGVA